MARATQPRASGQAADAITLLKQDHREVETLFENFEDAASGEAGTIAEQVCQMLTVHAEIEEEILYPAAKEAFEDEEDLELVNEANVEHASAKELIARIEAMTEDDELFRATVKVLGEYVKHHVKEEENELFPKLKKTGIDLADLGVQLQGRKAQLEADIGLAETMDVAAEEDDDTDEDQPSGRRATRAKAGTRPPAAR
ncbi:hemerythrin domain-containing protein [Povalibacter sp.]|uniref:hemerythrin domain-containing protein n=1 Tax=Povalibacter sp. TaxID=1962978 RepID=UPI002F4281CE